MNVGAQTDACMVAVSRRHDKATNAKIARSAGKAMADADHKAAAAHRKESDLPRLSSSVSVCMCIWLRAESGWGMSVGLLRRECVGMEGKEAGRTVATFPTQKTKCNAQFILI